MTSPNPSPAARPSPLASHPIDLVALFFGIGFVAVGGAVIADQLGWFSVSARSWTGVVLVTIGAVAVAGLIGGSLRRVRSGDV